MYDPITKTYADEAVVESFVGKTVTITITRMGFELSIEGKLVDLNGKGYYEVEVSDGYAFAPNTAKISFNKGTVNAAWVAASGNIIRLDA